MLRRNRCSVALATMACAAVLTTCVAVHAESPLGTAFTYQGRLEQSGVPVDGEDAADLRFTLYDGADSGANQIAGPLTFQGVDIVDGLFVVEVDFGVGAFNGDARFIQIEAAIPPGSTFVALDPRQPVTAAPYSMSLLLPFSQTATATLQPVFSLINTSPQGTYTLWAETYSEESVGTGLLGYASATTGSATGVLGVSSASEGSGIRGIVHHESGVNYAIYGDTNSTNGYAGYFLGGRNYFEGNVGIGTEEPGLALDVVGRARYFGDATNTAGFWLRQDTYAGALEGNAFIGMFDDDHIGFYGSYIPFFEDGAGWGLVWNRINGNLGIGTTAPQTKLDVAGTIRSTDGGFEFPDGTVQTTAATAVDVGWEADPNNGTISFDNGSVAFQHLPGGNERLYLATTTFSAAPSLKCEHFGSNFIVRPEIGGGTTTVLENTAGDLSLNPGRVTRVAALSISGGADVAEPFDVSGDAPITPGMVVSIDPAAPGKLRCSAQAYDTRVAGIVSGAGGVNPGMLLRQEESVADGSHPVALTGRVYCLADAEAGGAIQPGDLLTTSDTPGHAMKVTDRERAAGATIGKAMTALDHGQGLVLVLVNLQ